MLETSKLVMSWLCMLPSNDSTGAITMISYFLITLILFVTDACAAVSFSMFIFKFASIDLAGCLLAFMTDLAVINLNYNTICSIFLRQNLNSIFEKLSAIHNESKY